MAAREGQGLQIAVIIFALLSIVLAVATYAFYASGQTALKGEVAAKEAQARSDATNKELDYRLKACQYVLGANGITRQMVEDAGGSVTTPPPEVAKMLADFDADMKLIASYKSNEGADASYRTMGNILLTAINRKNANVADANDRTVQAQGETKAVGDREAARAQMADDAKNTANTNLTAEQANYAASIKSIKDDIAAIKTGVDTNNKENSNKVEALEKQVSDLTNKTNTDLKTIQGFKDDRKAAEAEKSTLFERPDGIVVWVNQRQRLVWIDVGRADGLMRQTTFSVFAHDVNGVTNAVPKARIEVVRLSEEHMAECRILEDSPANPILKGDLVHTPSWSPGQRVHFAMAGRMDIDGDKADDYETVRNVITLNGGIIDAEVKPNGVRSGELTVNTRYLVLGDPPDETAAKAGANILQEFTKIQTEVSRYGTDIIPVQKLLTQMGWKVEERTVELAGGKGGSAFRARKPGQPATPAGEAPAGGAAPSPAGGAPVVDPFAAPPGGAPPAGTPAADPFAAPGAAAAPAPGAPPAPAAADPFGPPKP